MFIAYTSIYCFSPQQLTTYKHPHFKLTMPVFPSGDTGASFSGFDYFVVNFLLSLPIFTFSVCVRI